MVKIFSSRDNFDLTCFLNSILIRSTFNKELKKKKKSTINDFYDLKNSSLNISLNIAIHV